MAVLRWSGAEGSALPRANLAGDIGPQVIRGCRALFLASRLVVAPEVTGHADVADGRLSCGWPGHGPIIAHVFTGIHVHLP